jgi:hypothetical protein
VAEAEARLDHPSLLAAYLRYLLRDLEEGLLGVAGRFDHPLLAAAGLPRLAPALAAHREVHQFALQRPQISRAREGIGTSAWGAFHKQSRSDSTPPNGTCHPPRSERTGDRGRQEGQRLDRPGRLGLVALRVRGAWTSFHCPYRPICTPGRRNRPAVTVVLPRLVGCMAPPILGSSELMQRV